LRVYASVEEMIAAERQREDGIRMLVIATPNHLHFRAAKAALEGGFAVMSEIVEKMRAAFAGPLPAPSPLVGEGRVGGGAAS